MKISRMTREQKDFFLDMDPLMMMHRLDFPNTFALIATLQNEEAGEDIPAGLMICSLQRRMRNICLKVISQKTDLTGTFFDTTPTEQVQRIAQDVLTGRMTKQNIEEDMQSMVKDITDTIGEMLNSGPILELKDLGGFLKGAGPLLQKHVMSNFCPPLGSIIDEESMEYDFLDLMGVKNG